MDPLGVYIHYPFCRSRCSYCDFPIAIVPEPEIPHARYADAIADELAERAPAFAGRELVSIYFGGGTPSLWPAAELGRVVGGVRERFAHRREPLEVTLEANPTDCDAETLAAWRSAGITRLSIGAQSANARELVTLGRDHRMGDGVAALESARGAGFESLSADIILGIPGAGDPAARAEASVDEIAGRNPEHLSVYELTFESATPLDARRRRGEIAPVDEDRLAAIYGAASRELSSRGYEHYEISSFARPGHRAVHNSLYWSLGEYLGLGTGASSFRRLPEGGGTRWRNVRSARRYLGARGEARVSEQESLSAEDLDKDRIWLGLRTSDGVPDDALKARPDLLEWLCGAGLARLCDGRVAPTLSGFLYADYVAQRVVCGE